MTIKHTVAVAALLVSGAVQAGEINTGYFGNIAIRGYDPVAYFTMSKATSGNPEISHTWLGAEWHFANEKHRDLFVADPVAYAPQYGGYCSDGVAYNTVTANIDPDAWRIINGKLYLNYDPGAAIEIEEIPGQIERAEAHWPTIKERIASDAPGG